MNPPGIDQIYCINLNRRPERWERMQARFYGLHWKVRRMQAIDARYMSVQSFCKKYQNRPQVAGSPKTDTQSIACALSHINCIRHAQRMEYGRILVLEDDAMFHHDIIATLQSKPLPEASVVYLGASQYNWDCVKPVDGFYRASETYGMFAYILKACMFDALVDLWMQFGTTCDGYMANVVQKDFNCPVYFPNLVVADVNQSDIRGPRNQIDQARKFRWTMSDYV